MPYDEDRMDAIHFQDYMSVWFKTTLSLLPFADKLQRKRHASETMSKVYRRFGFNQIVSFIIQSQGNCYNVGLL